MLSSRMAWIFFSLVLIFVGGVRLRMLHFPLERDEGEYACVGQLMLQGIPPYADVYNMKFPGVYAAYAMIMSIFGQAVSGIHLGILLVNAGTITLVFLIGRKLYGGMAGVMAAASYAILSMSQRSLGLAGHATHFVILPALGAVLLLIPPRVPGLWRVLFVGLLLGISTLMKQPGFIFALMAWLYILWLCLRRRSGWVRQSLISTVIFSVGFAIPLLLTGLMLWRAGVFARFWYWTIDYARTYGTQIPFAEGPKLLVDNFSVMAEKTLPLWGLAAAGFAMLFFDRNNNWRPPFVVLFVVFSFLAVCPGLLFRNHYFILLMPAAALLVGGGLATLRTMLHQKNATAAWLVPAVIFAAVWGYVFAAESNFLLRMNVDEACRATYGGNPFVESVEIAQRIKGRALPGDVIAVIGSEPQIYFYTGLTPATGYLYAYPLMEIHPDALRMQKEMAGQIEAATPKFVVFVSMRLSWLPRLKSEMWILDKWLDRYLRNYNVIGMIDVFFDGSQSRWDAAAVDASPVSRNFVVVLERKP